MLTAHGGHCAHLPLGSWITGKAWMDTVAMQFFSAASAQLDRAHAEDVDATRSTAEIQASLEKSESQNLLSKEQ